MVAMDANAKSMSVTKRWVSSNTIKAAATDADSLKSPPPPRFLCSIHCPVYGGILGDSHFPVSLIW